MWYSEIPDDCRQYLSASTIGGDNLYFYVEVEVLNDTTGELVRDVIKNDLYGVKPMPKTESEILNYFRELARKISEKRYAELKRTHTKKSLRVVLKSLKNLDPKPKIIKIDISTSSYVPPDSGYFEINASSSMRRH